MPPPASVARPVRPGARRRSLTSLWRLRGYLRPYTGSLVVMGSTALAGVLVSISIPLVSGALIDGPIADGDRGGILPLGLLALALGVLEAVLILIRRWVQARAVLGLERSLRDDIYEQLDSLPMAFHAHWQSGQLLSRITTDLSTIRRFTGFGMLFLVINILQLIVVTALLLHLYRPLGVVVALVAVPIIWLCMSFERRYVTVSRRVQDEQGDVATEIEESTLGVRTIKSFGRSAHAYEKYDRRVSRLYDSQMDKVHLSSRFWTFLEVLPNLALVAVLLLGARAVGQGDLTLGALVAFITLMLQLVWPVAALGVILSMAQEAMTAADRVVEIFDTESDIVGGERELDHSRGHLRLEGVGFTFPDATSPVLHDVDLEVLPGETLAIVGATGSGKTVLTTLIPRLYDPTAGRVSIDGVDIRELTLLCLRRVVATAFEDPTLFSMSARENVTLGRADASEADVREALEVAQAEFVDELPWGLDTRIGEQGMALSGGQRQRLALARAILARPSVLVLDDTLSALDVHTEALVERGLRSVLADTTGIVVAHRASTVLLADKVALLEGGTVTAVGRHSDLLATVPAYRELLSADPDWTDAELADATGGGAS
ncbi:MAG: ABC transporter ATP-binding protein/permease [Actinomycetota bacterium]|nr:ABC transporter ATP-binding protein/permease [Actinomycetota bacterium]